MQTFFEWASQSALGVAMRDSRYPFPAAEMVHLIGLGLLLGAVLLFNARFFGLGMRRQTLPEVAEDFAPWTLLALAIMVASGVFMFTAKAGELWEANRTTYYTKMGLIATAVVFHYAVQVPLARAGNLAQGRIAAAVSLALWFGAAMTGLSIEFL
jgi:hypothetical protein